MSNIVPCVFCGQPATIHLTQIINNHTHRIDVCESCAQKKGLLDQGPFSMANLLAKALAMAIDGSETVPPAIKELSCPHCGFKLSALKEKGILGCPDCYEFFKKSLGPILKEMHRNPVHVGKQAHTVLERSTAQAELTDLEKKLKEAVDGEQFEEAAKLRDELKKLREKKT